MKLPAELICEILYYIKDSKTIDSLLSSSKVLAALTGLSIKRLDNTDFKLSINKISSLRSLISIDRVQLSHPAELISLVKLPLLRRINKICINSIYADVNIIAEYLSAFVQNYHNEKLDHCYYRFVFVKHSPVKSSFNLFICHNSMITSISPVLLAEDWRLTIDEMIWLLKIYRRRFNLYCYHLSSVINSLLPEHCHSSDLVNYLISCEELSYLIADPKFSINRYYLNCLADKISGVGNCGTDVIESDYLEKLTLNTRLKSLNWIIYHKDADLLMRLYPSLDSIRINHKHANGVPVSSDELLTVVKRYNLKRVIVVGVNLDNISKHPQIVKCYI